MQLGVENSIIKYAIASTPTGSSVQISALEEFYLTNYILCNGQYYAEPFYTTNGYFRKAGVKGHDTSNTGKRIGYTTVEFWIPIKRISGYSKIQVEAKTIADNGKYNNAADANVINFGAGAVVNGTMQRAEMWGSKNTEWNTYTVNISDLPYVDYILLAGVDGSPAFRNIKLIRS